MTACMNHISARMAILGSIQSSLLALWEERCEDRLDDYLYNMSHYQAPYMAAGDQTRVVIVLYICHDVN